MRAELAVAPQADQVHVGLDPGMVTGAYAGHRRRFAAWAASLDDAALESPTRCSKWTVADVLRHGCDVDGWMRSIWSGTLPLDAFDPRTTPHESVVSGRSIPDREVRDRYVVSAEEIAADVGAAGPDRWALPALVPAGPVPWWMSVLHVLYDSWVHERDSMLPLGLPVPSGADERHVVLAWSLAIVGLFGGEPLDAVVAGFRVSAGAGPVTVVPVDDTLDAGVPVLRGDPAVIADALSGRGSLDAALDGHPAIVHRLGVLARFFATTP